MTYAPTRTFKIKTTEKNEVEETNKTLADPVRVNIVEALSHAEMSFQELAEMFRMDERLMLYHLRRLVRAGVITEYRFGGYVTYEVSDQKVASACHVLYELWAEEATKPMSQVAVVL